METLGKKEKLAEKYKHIKGWGVDADPKNEPTYPIKKYTGDDHARLNWKRPELQQENVEILKSTERPYNTAVFGTALPPKGLSGMLRRFAFRYSENMLRHWLILLAADRINVVEGMIDDLLHAKIPRLAKERGWGAIWKFHPALLVRKIAVRLIAFGGIAAFFALKAKKRIA